MSVHTVLIVEDDDPARDIFSTFLRHHGLTVLEAHDGDEGVLLAKSSGPDLIFMDLSMPSLDGYGAMRQLREDPTTAMIPIVAFTAHAMDGDRARALASGFDHYVSKPVEPTKLLELTLWMLGRD